jgi:hypothetical protein
MVASNVSSAAEVRRTGHASLSSSSPAFQWTENTYGDVMLLSLSTHRYLRVQSGTGSVFADHPGPKPGRKDGSCFTVRTSEGVL